MRFVFTSVLFILALSVLAQPRFVNPVKGSYGKDFIIVNYVDWGPEGAIKDHHCLSKTYNGHQGTDFVLRNFRQMDSGVNVLAVDTGVVIFTKDGEFDREKTSVISKGLGNYVGLSHRGKLQTYYAHLKKNSILVDVGDTVYPGQVIGQVASSGNSTDPHLHFELWYDSTYYIDPFKGPCGNGNTYWLKPFPFDSSFKVWTSSTWDGLPSLDTLREAPLLVNSFDGNNQQIAYWSLLYGLRKGDSIQVEWLTPKGVSWKKEVYELEADWWYYYYFDHIEMKELMPYGEWKVNLSRNGAVVDSRSFHYIKPTLVEDVEPFFDFKVWQHEGTLYHNFTEQGTYNLYSMSGAKISSGQTVAHQAINISGIPKGIYLISFQFNTLGVVQRTVVLK